MGKRRTIAELWHRLEGWPGGKWLFSWLLGRTARYTGSIGARVLELGPEGALVCMRDRAAVRNHLKSVHAIALMNLGELATGLAVMYKVDGRGRGIVKGLSMEYLKKARGLLRARCSAEIPLEPGTHDLEVEGQILNADGEVVAICRATWRVDVRAPASSSAEQQQVPARAQ